MGILYVLLFIAQILILVGALAWGFVAYNIDILRLIFPKPFLPLAQITIGASAALIISIRLYNVIDPMLRIK
jgi:uncharacterized membrane protein YuzA (DUF378 family)